ncbi:putative transcriptional regulatory protein YedW [termite gut metagenome]|uniref:Putative transcriptional regulatory protein YedW n=2 Tax=termite gut metagenome TaxID=433724 RepID=A0A5J4RZW0_9ZZZZ
MKILLIEDELGLAQSIIEYLSQKDYVCEQVSTYRDAMEKTALYTYDCILLDLMLPDGDGLAVLEMLKKEHKPTNVIIISAKNSLDDRVKGILTGADDYLPKPFHLSELSARIYALIRRTQYVGNNYVQSNDLKINLLSKEVFVNEEKIILTKKELDLLLFLIGNKNRVVSKNALAEHLSGDTADMFDNHDFVYAHIKNLKAKLSRAGNRNSIKTIYGMGYKWVE